MLMRRFLSLVLLMGGVFSSTLATAKSAKILSLFGSYSASLNDTASVSDFYDGFGVGGSLGYRPKAVEYFLSARKATQLSNYSNIADPEFEDLHFRFGLRFESAWKRKFFPVFELGADVLLLGGSGEGLGYGGSGGVGVGFRMGKRLAIRTVSELNMLFFSYNSLRRRFFNQRFDLAISF